MRRLTFLGIAMMAALLAPPVTAQNQFKTNGEIFVDAVRKDEAGKAMQLLREHPTLINARDTKGDTALLIALRRSDREWTGYLLNEGADVDLAARDGDTPIIAAARIGFDEAIGWLTRLKARVDASNKLGETGLIIAVQARNTRAIKTLLDAGADPDKTDYAGYSARDYAARDTRSRQMAALIEAKKPKK